MRGSERPARFCSAMAPVLNLNNEVRHPGPRWERAGGSLGRGRARAAAADRPASEPVRAEPPAAGVAARSRAGDRR